MDPGHSLHGESHVSNPLKLNGEYSAGVFASPWSNLRRAVHAHVIAAGSSPPRVPRRPTRKPGPRKNLRPIPDRDGAHRGAVSAWRRATRSGPMAEPGPDLG
ncbi:protein of unknown function [Streptomyces murinus]